MNLLKKRLKFIFNLLKINWFKTIYINFKTQNFVNACRFPIIVWGKCKIIAINGAIEFECPIRFGILQFGKDIDGFPASFLPTTLLISGKLLIKGNVVFSGGVNLSIWKGTVEIGNFCRFGSGCVIKCIEGISFGKMTRLSAHCVVMDTDVHFIRNIATGVTKKAFSPIVIGSYCWLNAGTLVGKGVHLPDCCITGRSAFLSKNSVIGVESCSFLVGSPARVRAKGVVRIFSESEEIRLQEYFLTNKIAQETKTFLGFPDEEYQTFAYFII